MSHWGYIDNFFPRWAKRLLAWFIQLFHRHAFNRRISGLDIWPFRAAQLEICDCGESRLVESDNG